jgi:UDP-GlcNAc:undecaprenyl-phosphate GlcNAc-1-phosphate transferase
MLGFIQPAVAFVATIILILLLRPVAMQVGLTDCPDTRKTHQGEMPLVGGIAIFLAVILAVGLKMLLSGGVLPDRYVLSFLGGSFLLVVVGVWDDWVGLSPLVRFIIQVCAACTMVYGGGIFLNDLGYLGASDEIYSLGDLSVPFTVFVVVGMINAINMTDGLDGLSGNMTLVSLAGLGIANSFWGNHDHLQLLNTISAAVAGFLVLNQRSFWRNTAWVFLGDAGSMMLGFALIWNAIDIARLYPQIISPAATLWFLAVPIFDTVTMMIRRISDGRSPFQADSEHLHHLLVRSGMTVGETIGTMCVLQALGCGVGLLVTYFGVPDTWVALGFLLTGIVYLLLMKSAWKKEQPVR